MGDVGVDHQEIVVSDTSRTRGVKRSMDGYMFSDHITGPDNDQTGVFGHVDMLGRPAENRSFKNLVIRPQPGPIAEDYAAFQSAPIADDHIRLNYAKRADFHSLSNLGLWTDRT